jgi:hypothetical protein
MKNNNLKITLHLSLKDTHFINILEIHSFASKACIGLNKDIGKYYFDIFIFSKKFFKKR